MRKDKRVDESWCRRMVSWNLESVRLWLEKGYRLTEGQRALLEEIASLNAKRG